MRKHCNRKVRDPMDCILKRIPLSESQTRDVGIAYHSNLDAMRRGHGTEQAWSTLACAINVSLILCEKGVCAEALETIKLAQDALMSTKRRAHEKSRWAFNGDEMRIVTRAVAIHDEQNAEATRGQVRDALNEVHRRLEAGECLQ